MNRRIISSIIALGLLVGLTLWSAGSRTNAKSLSAAAPPSAFTSLGAVQEVRDLYIVAHQDDDLLFMNPNIQHSITAGHKVKTVYVTAGDACNGPGYWKDEREAGVKAAYARMAGPNVANNWTQTDSLITEFKLDGREVSLVFFRLPATQYEDGTPCSHGQSLEQLWLDNITTISAHEGSNTYTKQELIDALTDLIKAFQPTRINTLDSIGGQLPCDTTDPSKCSIPYPNLDGDYYYYDHSDHYHSALFALEARNSYGQPHVFRRYRGYSSALQSENVTGEDFTKKQGAFETYGEYDSNVGDDPPFGKWYDAWILRQYTLNTPPTIAASGVTVTAAAPASTSQITTVSDAQDDDNTLTVTVNGSSSATVGGVTVSGISVDSSGRVTASVLAACTATTASFTLRITDSGGLFAEADLTVDVSREMTAPVITCSNVPAQAAAADAYCQATVPDVRSLVRAQSSDNCTPQAALTVTQSPEPGRTVSGVGSHPITITVTDEANNSAMCEVAFTVSDTTAPTILCPTPIAVDGSNVLGGAAVNFSATASDNCGGAPSLTYSKAPGSLFSFGVTTVTVTANDGRGNSSPQCSFTVTVRTPQQQTTLLKTQVQVLVTAGALTPAQGAGLTDKLNETITKLNQGQKGAACNQLNAFIAQVNALIGGNVLTSAQGQALISAANNVKVNLGC